MSPITLPGSIRGLLRRGSPVRSALYADSLGVVVDTGYSLGARILWSWSEALVWTVEHPFSLDLTDATGRAHAAWWLAGEVGASWTLECEGYRRWCLHSRTRPRCDIWRCYEGVGETIRRLRSVGQDHIATDVPFLDDLDPDDDTRLLDGSRRVDAEALRRVCLHVAGLPLTP